MEEDIKSMPSWFWYIGAAVAAIGIFLALKNKSSSSAGEIAAMSQSAGVAPSSGSSTDFTTPLNAIGAKIVSALGAGMTQMEADLEGYIDQQTASIQSGFGAMATQLDTNFSKILDQTSALSASLTAENSAISANQAALVSSLGANATQSAQNQATQVGYTALSWCISHDKLCNIVKQYQGACGFDYKSINTNGGATPSQIQCLGKSILGG
jgi:hypothetical protein